MESRLIFLHRCVGDVGTLCGWASGGQKCPWGNPESLLTKRTEAQSRKATKIKAHDRTKTDTGRRGE